MINVLSSDIVKYPHLFDLTRPRSDISLKNPIQDVFPPPDLVELWDKFGGGEMFESETILLPYGSPENVYTVTDAECSKGLKLRCAVFHIGSFISAFQEDNRISALENDTHIALGIFDDIDSWYVTMLRSEFASRYGMQLG